MTSAQWSPSAHQGLTRPSNPSQLFPVNQHLAHPPPQTAQHPSLLFSDAPGCARLHIRASVGYTLGWILYPETHSSPPTWPWACRSPLAERQFLPILTGSGTTSLSWPAVEELCTCCKARNKCVKPFCVTISYAHIFLSLPRRQAPLGQSLSV